MNYSPHFSLVRSNFVNKHAWKPTYQRNNKKKDMKNIRCFPTCKPIGHIQQGFCGTPVFMELFAPSGIEISAYGHLTPVNLPPLFSVGSPLDAPLVRTLHQAELFECPFTELPPEENFLSCAAGRVRNGQPSKYSMSSTGVMTAIFKRGCKGWGYSWKGKKRSGSIKHCFRVYVFSQNVCVGIFASPKFAVFSRKSTQLSKSINDAAMLSELAVQALSESRSASSSSLSNLDEVLRSTSRATSRSFSPVASQSEVSRMKWESSLHGTPNHSAGMTEGSQLPLHHLYLQAHLQQIEMLKKQEMMKYEESRQAKSVKNENFMLDQLLAAAAHGESLE